MQKQRSRPVKMHGVPQFSNNIAEALKLREHLTPDEEAQADAQIAAAREELRRRQIDRCLRSPSMEEGDDDEA